MTSIHESTYVTPTTSNDGLVYACLTHIPLWVNYPSYVTPIYLGQAQAEGQVNLRDWAPEWEPHHPVLGGAVGSFALKNYIKRNFPETRKVGICQYRKFVSNQRISGVVAPGYRVMDLVAKDSVSDLTLEKPMHPGTQTFLISRPFSFWHVNPRHRRGYLEDYKRCHHMDDLLRFAAVATELGVLEKGEAESFFREQTFIPGGIELGVYPADFWLKNIAAMEDIVRECVRTDVAVRTGYQVRAWAFCSERLGSYLLLRHFGALGSHRMRYRTLVRAFPPEWVKRFSGQLNLITLPGTTDYTVGV